MYLRNEFNRLFPNGTESDYKIFIAGATVTLAHVRSVGAREDVRKERATSLAKEMSLLLHRKRLIRFCQFC